MSVRRGQNPSEDRESIWSIRASDRRAFTWIFPALMTIGLGLAYTQIDMTQNAEKVLWCFVKFTGLIGAFSVVTIILLFEGRDAVKTLPEVAREKLERIRKQHFQEGFQKGLEEGRKEAEERNGTKAGSPKPQDPDT